MTGQAVREPDTADVRKLGAVSAVVALVSLLIGGTLAAITARPTAVGVAAVICEQPGAVVGAGLALAAVSLFDLGTVPALHRVLRRRRPTLVLIGAATAVIGDVLGIMGRLAQSSLGTLGPHADSTAIVAIGAIEQMVNAAGLALVGVAFISFGVAFVRAGSRGLGYVGIATGVATAVGQVPTLGALFMAANLGFVAWYVGLAVTFGRSRPPA